jgi:hypothetical protein
VYILINSVEDRDMRLNFARRIVLIAYALGFVAITLFFVPKKQIYGGYLPLYTPDFQSLTSKVSDALPEWSSVTDGSVYLARLVAWTIVCGVAFVLFAPANRTSKGANDD